MIDRFTNVHVALPPPPSRLYLPVNVVLPGLSPLMTDDALARCKVPEARVTELASTAVMALAPVPAKDMKQDTAPELPVMPLVTDSSTLPEAGTVSVTAGPTEVRSAYVSDDVTWLAATLSATVSPVPEPGGPWAPVAPLAPVGPRDPVAPVAPVGPRAPVGPWAPGGPCGPVAPVAPVGP